jgi:thioredoxin
MKTKNLTKSEFVKKISDIKNNPNKWNYLGERPAIIDFYATWCGPCKMLAPILDDIAVEYEGRVDVYKVNVEEEKELANFFGIRSIPSILFIPMLGKLQMVKGALPKKIINETINSTLLNQ